MKNNWINSGFMKCSLLAFINMCFDDILLIQTFSKRILLFHLFSFDK